MPTIRFSIGTQSFTLACEDGEEGHIRLLEKSVNNRFESMQRTFGSAGNQLVMAVTMLMMEEDLQKAKERGDSPVLVEQSMAAKPEINEKQLREHIRREVLEELTSRLETLAENLENV